MLKVSYHEKGTMSTPKIEEYGENLVKFSEIPRKYRF